MEQLIDAFAQQSEHSLIQVNASSGTLFNQINHGAPFDMLLSADLRYPMLLENSGKGVKGTLYSYAQGQLVLLFSQPPNASPDSEQQRFTNSIVAIQKRQAKIAIANPTIAPYGIAARQALQYLQLWHQDNSGQVQDNRAQDSWVRGNNVGQAFQFVITGNAAAGFVARSQLVQLASSMDNGRADKRRAPAYWNVPQDWYQPIRQGAILLQSARDNKAANTFLLFLQSDKAKRIIRDNGYTLPEALPSPASHQRTSCCPHKT